jgi:hypothetical protein
MFSRLIKGGGDENCGINYSDDIFITPEGRKYYLDLCYKIMNDNTMKTFKNLIGKILIEDYIFKFVDSEISRLHET